MSSSASWRDVMSSAELAAFDADPSNYCTASIANHTTHYENAHHDPRRSEREVSLHSGIPAPETDTDRTQYLTACAEIADGFHELPALCHVCGTRLKTDASASRVTVLIHFGKKRDQTLSFCRGCISLPEPKTTDVLTPLQKRVRQMLGEGMTQIDIAKKLGVSQSKVSRLRNESIM